MVASAFGQNPEERFTAMDPEQRRAFEIEVMEKVADLALIPPKLNTSPLPKYDYDQLAYGMTIGIARTPGGRLWACWVAGEDGAKAFFVCAVSDDDGETWSKPVLVIDGQSEKLPMPRSVLVGNLWTDPLGGCGSSSTSRWRSSTVAPACGRRFARNLMPRSPCGPRRSAFGTASR